MTRSVCFVWPVRRWRLLAVAAGAAFAIGCSDEGSCKRGAYDHIYASEVMAVSYGSGQSFGRQAMPDVVFGPPLGAGMKQGSLDVVSLGNGGSITLAFGDNIIVDGPGADFIVFENPFEGPAGLFAELATVEISEDGETWLGYPCTTSEPPYDRCAGVTPVLATDDPEGPLDPAAMGGDSFDLAELGAERARYVRITDRADINGLAGVFDLDAVGVVHGSCL